MHVEHIDGNRYSWHNMLKFFELVGYFHKTQVLTFLMQYLNLLDRYRVQSPAFDLEIRGLEH